VQRQRAGIPRDHRYTAPVHRLSHAEARSIPAPPPVAQVPGVAGVPGGLVWVLPTPAGRSLTPAGAGDRSRRRTDGVCV